MYTAKDHDTAEVREAEEFRDTMEVEVVMAPPRHPETTWHREYILSSLHLRSHMLAVDWPELGHYFTMPSNHQAKEKLISRWAPQNSHPSSPSVLSVGLQSAVAPTSLYSSSIDEACEYLKLQEKNILEKHFIVYDNTWIKMEITNSCLIWSCGSPNNWATPVRIEVSVPGTESPVWPATISNKYLCVCMNGLVRDYGKSFPRILGFKIRELHIETILPVCVLCMTDFGGQNTWNESTDIPSNSPLFMTDWH